IIASKCSNDHGQSAYTNSNAPLKDSSSAKSIPGGACTASYKIPRSTSRARPSSISHHALNVASPAEPTSGIHEFNVSIIREPVLVNFAFNVECNAVPPLDGNQCSNSSAITHVARAPSAE